MPGGESSWIRRRRTTFAEGVTTLMEGNDGSSPIPLAPFLQKVAEAHPAVNFGTFVGQGSIRDAVIGLANRKATPEEISPHEGSRAPGHAGRRFRAFDRPVLRSRGISRPPRK